MCGMSTIANFLRHLLSVTLVIFASSLVICLRHLTYSLATCHWRPLRRMPPHLNCITDVDALWSCDLASVIDSLTHPTLCLKHYDATYLARLCSWVAGFENFLRTHIQLSHLATLLSWTPTLHISHEKLLTLPLWPGCFRVWNAIS